MQSFFTTNARGSLSVSKPTGVEERMQAIEDKLQSAFQRFDSLRKAHVLGDEATQAGYDSNSLQKLEDMAATLKSMRQEESRVSESLYRKKTVWHRLKNTKMFGMAISDDDETRRKAAAEIIHSLIRTPSQFYRLLKAMGFSSNNDMPMTLALDTVQEFSISETMDWLAEPETTQARLEGEVQQLKQQVGECQAQVNTLIRERDAASAARETERSHRRAERDTLEARKDLASRGDEIQRLQKTHGEELLSLRREHEEEVRRLRLRHEQELQKLQREQQSENLQQAIVRPAIPCYSLKRRYRSSVWEEMSEMEEPSTGVEIFNDVNIDHNRED